MLLLILFSSIRLQMFSFFFIFILFEIFQQKIYYCYCCYIIEKKEEEKYFFPLKNILKKKIENNNYDDDDDAVWLVFIIKRRVCVCVRVWEREREFVELKKAVFNSIFSRSCPRSRWPPPCRPLSRPSSSHDCRGPPKLLWKSTSD